MHTIGNRIGKYGSQLGVSIHNQTGIKFIGVRERKITMHSYEYKLLACYNQWMNKRLYDVCSRLSDEERKKDRKIFFSSVHGTLSHLLLRDQIWLGRFENKPIPMESLAQELFSDFKQLRKERDLTDARIIQWADGLSGYGAERQIDIYQYR